MDGPGKDLVAATLAAALIQTRGVTTAEEMREAFDDAFWTLYPDTSLSSYKQWAERRRPSNTNNTRSA